MLRHKTGMHGAKLTLMIDGTAAAHAVGIFRGGESSFYPVEIPLNGGVTATVIPIVRRDLRFQCQRESHEDLDDERIRLEVVCPVPEHGKAQQNNRGVK